MDKMVSVVITTYKREPAIIQQAIDSVVRQTYENIEVILVDDNGFGTDYQQNNEEYFARQDKVRYIPNKTNQGAQYSRNVGILASKGEYVAFLDDDDWWAKEKIEKQMAVFKDPQIGLVFCNGVIVKENENDLKEQYRDSGPRSYFGRLIDYDMMLTDDCVGSTSQVLIRKECFTKVGLFDYEMKARQDYEMWIRISKEFKLWGIDEPLFYHRMHEGEQISKNSKKVIDGYQRLLDKNRNDFKTRRFAKARMVFRIAFVYFKAGDKLNGLKYTIKGALISPRCFFYKLNDNSMFTIRK